MFISKLLSLLLIHLPIREISLQRHKYFSDVLLGVAFDLFDPPPDVFETLLVVDRVGQDYSSCAFIVGLCDVFESLLAGCVPYLEFDFWPVHIDCFEFEIYADGRNVAVFEHPVAEFGEEDGFAYPAVSDDDDFG